MAMTNRASGRVQAAMHIIDDWSERLRDVEGCNQAPVALVVKNT